MKRGRKPEELLRLLGPEFEDEPSSAQLAAYLRGELDDEALAKEAETFLRENAHIAEQLRAALEWSDALEETDDDPRRAVLSITSPPLRAAAASQQQDTLPLPDERRVLLDEGGVRIVYLREGERARLGLFRSAQSGRLDDLRVHLDDDSPPLHSSAEDARIYDLGPARRLPGHELSLEREGVSWRWLLVEDTAG